MVLIVAKLIRKLLAIVPSSEVLPSELADSLSLPGKSMSRLCYNQYTYPLT